MDNAAVAEMFDGLGPVTIKKLFGGKGIYHHGLIVAIVLRDELMLKADEQSSRDFAGAGSNQWTYTHAKRKTLVAMPYWSVPNEAVDDPEKFTKWARKAYEAAVRAQK